MIVAKQASVNIELSRGFIIWPSSNRDAINTQSVWLSLYFQQVAERLQPILDSKDCSTLGIPIAAGITARVLLNCCMHLADSWLTPIVVVIQATAVSIVDACLI